MFSPDIFKVWVFWRGSKFVFGVQTLVYVSSNVQVQNSSVGYIRIQSTNKLWVTTCTFWKQSSVVWNSHISLKSDRALKCLWTTHNPIKTNFGGITQLQTRLKVMKTVNWMMLAARQKKSTWLHGCTVQKRENKISTTKLWSWTMYIFYVVLAVWE